MNDTEPVKFIWPDSPQEVKIVLEWLKGWKEQVKEKGDYSISFGLQTILTPLQSNSQQRLVGPGNQPSGSKGSGKQWIHETKDAHIQFSYIHLFFASRDQLVVTTASIPCKEAMRNSLHPNGADHSAIQLSISTYNIISTC